MPLGAVTEVRIGIETGEMIPPMMAGTRLISTSCLAASTATAPWLWASRISATSLQPPGPPASFRSRNASSTDLAPAWPNWPAGPVSSITTPTVTVHWASATAESPATPVRKASNSPSGRRDRFGIGRPPCVLTRRGARS